MSTPPTFLPLQFHRRAGVRHIGPGLRFNSPAMPPAQFISPDEPEENPARRQAELFYLRKQIQAQTPMVIVLEDGEHIEGTIEWYDRQSLKVRGRARTLVYKSAIKYMYKLGDAGSSA